MLDSVKPLLEEHQALQTQLSDASVHANPGLAKKLNRRYAELSAIVNAFNQVNSPLPKKFRLPRKSYTKPTRSCVVC
jgi:protein subunit release factor A